MTIIDNVLFNEEGLLPVITQDVKSGKVLMLAWMNRQALELSIAKKQAVYYSRSRQTLWQKGEQSGNIQWIKAFYLDCDQDALLIKVEQQNSIACHTGRASCFFHKIDGEKITVTAPILKAPQQMYKNDFGKID